MFSTVDLLRKAEDAPTAPGAYVLLIGLPVLVEVALPGKPKTTLCAGRYLYCGSAKGPGGIRARLARNMRIEKSIRWHVDRLTEADTVIGAWSFPGRDECDLVRTLTPILSDPRIWQHRLRDVQESFAEVAGSPADE